MPRTKRLIVLFSDAEYAAIQRAALADGDRPVAAYIRFAAVRAAAGLTTGAATPTTHPTTPYRDGAE